MVSYPVSTTACLSHFAIRANEPARLLLSVEQTPVLNLKRVPYLGGILDSISDQLALFSQCQVHLLLVVFALDVRHVDGDQDVRLLLLQSQKREDNGREVGRRGALSGLDLGSLRSNQGVGGDVLSVVFDKSIG